MRLVTVPLGLKMGHSPGHREDWESRTQPQEEEGSTQEARSSHISSKCVQIILKSPSLPKSTRSEAQVRQGLLSFAN